MTIRKKSKKVILLLALLVLALGTALLSGTFAANVDYSTEKIALTDEKGNYNVDVEYIHSNSHTADYADFMTAANFSGASCWCPGRTEILYLKITNNEAFPINCSVSLNVKESGFDDTLHYAFLSRDLLTDRAANHPASWADYVTAAGSSAILQKGSHPLWQQVTLLNDQPQYLAVAIHMDESASSQYENKTMLFNYVFRYDADKAPGDSL